MQISANTFTPGYSANAVKTGSAETNHDPVDTVTLTLRPEQLGDKNIQAFLRQMAMNGSSVNLNLAGGNDNSSSNNGAADAAADKAARSAADAQTSANSAQAAAERAAEVERRINNRSTGSGPPTYSEG